MKIEYLKDQPDFVPMLASWYFKEWGQEVASRTLTIEISELQKALNKDKTPLAIIATNRGELVGGGLLKGNEMSIYPDKEHWLGGIFVKKEERKNGVALLIIERLLEIAKGLKIDKLYLQTEKLDGGLYKKMGWVGLERIELHNTQVLIMEKRL